MVEIKVWALGGIALFLMGILGFVSRTAVTKILEKLEEIKAALMSLSSIATRHEAEITTLRDDIKDCCKDLDNLEERLRKVEADHRFLMFGKAPAETL